MYPLSRIQLTLGTTGKNRIVQKGDERHVILHSSNMYTYGYIIIIMRHTWSSRSRTIRPSRIRTNQVSEFWGKCWNFDGEMAGLLEIDPKFHRNCRISVARRNIFIAQRRCNFCLITDLEQFWGSEDKFYGNEVIQSYSHLIIIHAWQNMYSVS